MNNPSNETLRPSSAQTPAAEETTASGNEETGSAAPTVPAAAQDAEDDQRLLRFLETAADAGKSRTPAEDPFFSPLPEIEIPEEEDDEEPQSAPIPTATAVTEELADGISDCPAEEAEQNETTYISEQSLREETAATEAKAEPDADSTASEEASSDAQSEPDTPAEEQRAKPRLGRIIGIAAGCVGGVLLLVFCVLCVILFRLSGPITVDLDETVSLGALRTHPILSRLTEAEPEPGDVDTTVIAERQIHLTFFGFLPRTVNVSVCDLTLPAVTPYRMTVGVGTVPLPSDCVLLCEDKTEVTHTFAEAPDTSTPGERTCILLSTDAGGNTVQTEVALSVQADACTQNIEFGTDAAAIAELLADAYPEYPTFDLSAVDALACGSYRVTAETAGERAILSLVLADTTPPKGTKRNYNLLSGTTLAPEDFVTNLRDASAVTLSYRTAPDFESLAPQTVVVAAEDAAGNITEFSCALQIWNIAQELTAECGTTLDTLRDTLFAAMQKAGAELPTFDSSFDPETLAPGTYDVRLIGKYSRPTVSLTMVDTTPPVLTTAPITAYIGHTLIPDRFVAELSDATEVKLSFKTEPDTSRAGNITVTVIAEDAGGNKVESTTTASVIADTAAPAIYGVKTIYAQQNGTVSYRSGVSAYDNADGNVAVKVDASGVDVNRVGKYYVTYTATDKAGNTAKQTAAVYVTGANEASVSLYANEILSVITTPGMTDTQKAYAIYTWCVGHLRYSTATSHLMGKFIEAAYSGFTSHIGNCYTYYAVASALLTHAGIENIEIQRNNPKAPHYWNLVKINGNWYHLDTCPKWKSHPIQTFLLTDWQVKQYSTYELEGYYSFDPSLYPATP